MKRDGAYFRETEKDTLYRFMWLTAVRKFSSLSERMILNDHEDEQ